MKITFPQFANEVYRFTKDTVELAYKWDFGPANINLKPFKERVKEDPNVFPQLTESHEIPYSFFRQFQNKDYYYTVLNTWNIDKWCNVFYRKKDGKSFVFDTLEGGAKIKKTSIFTDEYMISIVSPEEIGTFHNSLPAEEFNKVKRFTGRCEFLSGKILFQIRIKSIIQYLLFGNLVQSLYICTCLSFLIHQSYHEKNYFYYTLPPYRHYGKCPAGDPGRTGKRRHDEKAPDRYRTSPELQRESRHHQAAKCRLQPPP